MFIENYIIYINIEVVTQSSSTQKTLKFQIKL